MLMGSIYAGGETTMCTPESSRTRRGGKTKAAAEQKANKQPQRGLGVAQLEKIRLHNQMMAAYRSGGMHQDGARIMQQHQVPFSSPGADELMMAAGSSPFQPSYHHHTAATGVQYYGNLQPYSSSPPAPSLFAHDVRDSSGRRLGQGTTHTPPPPPQQHYWVSTSDESSGSAEELDLELRL